MRLRVATLFAAILVVAGSGTSAYAFFTAAATSGSHGKATAGTLPAGSTPTLSLSGREVDVSWTQSALPGGNGGYVLKRYAESAGGPLTPGASCDGLQPGPTCTENGVPTGRWTYTVSPHYGNWVGRESTPSAVVSIAPVAPDSVTLTSAAIDNTNASDVDVDVAVPDTSLATDTVRLTIKDGSNEVTQSARPAVDGATIIHFTGLDVSSLSDGALSFAATSASSYGDDSPTTSRSYAKETVVTATPSPPSESIDTTAPVLRATILNDQDGSYLVYADATDDLSGVDTASLTANVDAISGGAGGDCGGDCTRVALTYTADGFSVSNADGSTSTYHYRSAQLTAETPSPAGPAAFTVSGRDLAGNAATTGNGKSRDASSPVWRPPDPTPSPPSESIDTTAPVLRATILNDQDGSYLVYADATDDLSGVDTASLTANVDAISGGAGGDCGGDCTRVALTYTADGFSVSNADGTTSTYHYRSAQLTAETPSPAGPAAFTVSGRDLAGNAATTGNGKSRDASR